MTEMIQGTDAWLQARVGKVTASRVADVVAKTKSGWGASRANYMAELIAERLTGTPATSFTSPAMQWGTENEPLARANYEFRFDCKVTQVGFIEHPSIAMFGSSPDGHISDDGSLEIKCPNTATHLEMLLGEPISAKYITQMQSQMSCTGRKWCDFVSFDPRLPESMRMFVQRVNRDSAMILQLEKNVTEFLAELDQKIRALTEQYGQKAEAA